MIERRVPGPSPTTEGRTLPLGAIVERVVELPRPIRSDFDRIARGTAIGLFGWCGLNALLPLPVTLPTYYFRFDVLWLLLIAAGLLLATRWPTLAFIKPGWITILCRTGWTAVSLTAAIGLVTLLGGRFVYQGFALSRDEVMARFDAAIVRHGRLVADVPERWRSFAAALQPKFALQAPGNAVWSSTYLPGNAALRALLDGLHGIDLASPAMAALSVAATFGVARRIWPERRDTAVVASLLLATSTQALVTAFTPYAMTAHLALNMVWLWFFLRGRAWDHVAALLVGALACGLHQIVFHPLFVAPFIAQLWWRRRWATAASYTLAYAVIALFWILYWQLVLKSHGLEAIGNGHHGLSAFADQVLELLRALDWSAVELMGKNLTRFLAWQNPLVIPLAAAGLWALRDVRGPLPALAMGLFLTILTMGLLVPYQGHGWGYRYVHGCLGSMCLVAAAGWARLASPNDGATMRLWSHLLVACFFAIAIQLPGRSLEVERFIEPFVSAEGAITAVDTDAVVLDTRAMPFSEDLVRNDPFLRNRPLIFDLKSMTPGNVRALCAQRTVTLFDIHDGERFNLPTSRMSPSALGDLMKTLDCGRPMPGRIPRSPTDTTRDIKPVASEDPVSR